ncbi:MAG: hypothetical protein ACK53T_00055 [Planctomycetota bacterium]|jgi:hypothetical protein
MSDMTIVWKGAVPLDQWMGRSQDIGADAVAMVDPATISAGFKIKPFLDTSFESAMKGAVPYQNVATVSDGGDIEDLFLDETPKGK